MRLTLKSARVGTGMSQDEMAKELHVSRNTYIDYENLKTPMRIDTALLFSEIVDVPIDNLIFLNKNYTSSVQ